MTEMHQESIIIPNTTKHNTIVAVFLYGTLRWARYRLKSPASRLFTQSFIQAQIKEHIKAPRHWPLCPRGIKPGPVNSPHKGPVTRKMCPFDDVIMYTVHHLSHSKSRYGNSAGKTFGILLILHQYTVWLIT